MDVQSYALIRKSVLITKAISKFSENSQVNCYLDYWSANVCKWVCDTVLFKQIYRQ